MRTWPSRIGGVLRPALVDKVDRDHRQSDAEFLRRRIVVGITLVIGATLLGLSLNADPTSPTFYPLTVALAATWVIGGFASGPLHLGRINFRGELRRTDRAANPARSRHGRGVHRRRGRSFGRSNRCGT